MIDLGHLLDEPNKLAAFDDFYTGQLKPRLVKEYSAEPECLVRIAARFHTVMDYNVPHGKKLRGLCVYESFLNLIDDGSRPLIAAKKIEEAKAIGWCVEFVSFSFYFITS
jgi:hypothetical protein